MIMLHVRYGFPADKVEQAVEYFGKMQAASRAEPGCISYTIYRAKDDPTLFYIHEEWRDQAALDAHNAMPHFKEYGMNGLRPIAVTREVTFGEPLFP